MVVQREFSVMEQVFESLKEYRELNFEGSEQKEI